MSRVAVAVDAMFEHIPNDWWQFVPCATCNAPRQQPCMAWDMAARKPHAARVRAGQSLHGTLWLLDNGYAADVLGDPAA